VLMQISESRLPCHCKTVGECLYACSQKWNLVLAHKSYLYDVCYNSLLQNYELFSKTKGFYRK